jgi:hypothetical protein
MKPVRRADEGGAILVLAVIFMIIVALMLLALLNLSGNDLLNTSNLLSQQSLEYSAGGATNTAIENVRYNPSVYSSSGQNCLAGVTSISLTYKLPIFVDCVSVTNPAPPAPQIFLPPITREVIFYACVTGSCSPGSPNDVITATVDFVDGPTCSTSSTGACGSQLSIKSWLVSGAGH